MGPARGLPETKMPPSPRALSSSRAVSIHDLRTLAQKRLPRVVFDYIEGGAEGEFTLRENIRAFEAISFRPRHAVATGDCDLNTQVAGQKISFPAILAPIGYSRLMHPGGDVAAARAAGEAGTAYILSTISGYKLEDVKAATTGPAWYQLYFVAGRQAAEAAIERARKAGYHALVVTIDSPVAGMRERDHRNGMKALLGGSLFEKIPYTWQFFTHPSWVANFLLDGGVPKLENIVIPGQGPMELVDVAAALGRASVTWDDLRWIRQMWPGPIMIKGVLTAEDARRSIDAGAAAVMVSNHGGRQLDSVPAALHALPEIVAAVRGQAEVLVDGGIRRGSDIVKALCLGARAVLIGRAYIYGLAAAGQPGVARAIEILRDDVHRTLRLLGCPSVSALDSSYIQQK